VQPPDPYARLAEILHVKSAHRGDQAGSGVSKDESDVIVPDKVMDLIRKVSFHRLLSAFGTMVAPFLLAQFHHLGKHEHLDPDSTLTDLSRPQLEQ